MKIDLLGMILACDERRAFDAILTEDDGSPIDAVRALDHMILEYAKVRFGGRSDIVAVPASLAPLQPGATWDASIQGGDPLHRTRNGITHSNHPDGSPATILAATKFAK